MTEKTDTQTAISRLKEKAKSTKWTFSCVSSLAQLSNTKKGPIELKQFEFLFVGRLRTQVTKYLLP